MAILDVYNTQKQKVAEVEVADAVFDAEIKEHLFYDVVRMQLANRRSGTSATKSRGEVSGGGKKPWRQKGTGRARAGSSRSPLWRGGAVTFGPKPRSFTINLPKKVRRQALCSALTMKRKTDRLMILDKIELPDIKTRHVAQILTTLGAQRVLIIDEHNERLQLSARNIPGVKVLRPEGLNLYDVLSYENLYITQPCLEKIQRRLVA
ncbi:MAG: 50S ribosomal protein L4 [Desulfobacterota bacterium]|nr:50S ribosomal protein L4 [Thermodesulfobacteriota bacterium]